MTDNLIEIPGYTVHGRLGKGGMAEVYLATQQSLHRKVAVKVLLNAGDQEFNTRFIQEGHIVASLHNPSIITIYDINKLADGRYYMAMEFVPGGDLAQHKGRIFEPERALRIVQQIAGALAVVHGKGLIHRDIKPANILFRHDGTAVLTDFGIAKDMQIDSELTHFGVAVGSPAYSSPEQTQCQRLDARSDIYSLGLILLEMLTGSNPYRGSNYTQTVLNQVQMPVPVLPAHLTMFQALLERMLTKDPLQRLPDCSALLAALAQIELGDPDATQIRPAMAVSSSLPASVQMPGQVATAGPSLRRRFYWVLAGLLLLCGLVAAGGSYYQQQMHISDLLAQAEQRLAQGQLIAPQQDSAEHYFQQVLKLDSDNAKALAGLERVLDLRIQGLLASAVASEADNRWLLPEGDSAVFYYRQILLLAPGNAQAIAGLLGVAQQYREMALERSAKGQYKAALEMTDRGLQAQPDNPELLAMQTELAAKVAEAERNARQKAQDSRPAGATQRAAPAGQKNWLERWIDTAVGE